MSRPRTPGYIYAAVVLALLVLIASITLTSRQPPPPTIAEFAPQAVEQITEPSESSSRGASAGSEAGSQPESIGALPSPSPDAIQVPKVRKCVGDPPRQTEDPQSPPCVPYWTGDNGGATWRGVTRDEIRVALPAFLDDIAAMNALVAHFNRRYELYGRQLRLFPFTPAQGGLSNQAQASQMQADAVRVDEQLGAFVSMAHNQNEGADYHYYDEIARRKIIGVDGFPTIRDTAYYDRMKPYQWSLMPQIDTMLGDVADWACRSLVGRPPIFAGEPIVRTAPSRVFGILRGHATSGEAPDVSPLADGLRSCGAKVTVRDLSAAQDAAEGENHVLAFRDAGVTSVFCICMFIHLVRPMHPAATSQGWFPEWLGTTYGGQDDDNVGTQYQQEHAAHSFGTSAHNKTLLEHENPWFWAEKEGDAARAGGNGGQNLFIRERYQELLVIASGVQMAGPKLTPDTFRAGLIRTKFPNPNAGAAPYYQAHVGFGPNDYGFMDDYALIWFDPTTESPETNRGGFCYVDQGVRRSRGAWPDVSAFFSGACR